MSILFAVSKTRQQKQIIKIVWYSKLREIKNF